MLRPTLLFFILIFFVACEPQVTFDEPQPADIKNLKIFPSRLQGEYESIEDNSILVISEHSIRRVYDLDFKVHIDSLDENYKIYGDSLINLESDEKTILFRVGDTIYFNFHFVNTIFELNQHNIVRKFKGYYFINERYSQDRWEVKKIKLSKGQLTISKISTMLEIENLASLTESKQDTVPPYNIKATKRQFKKFIRNEGFKDSEVFIRRSGRVEMH